MKAAVHLGRKYQEHLRTTKNTDFNKIKHLFDFTEIVLDQDQELYGLESVRSTLLNDKVFELSTAKVYVFSDSVICLGERIAEYPRSVKSWKDTIERFTQFPEYRELDSVDGKPVVLEWENFSQGTTLQFLQEVRKHDERHRSETKRK